MALSACSAATTGSGDTATGARSASASESTPAPTASASPTSGPSVSPSRAAAPSAVPSLACGETTFDDGHQAVRYCGKGTATIEQGRAVSIPGSLCEDRGAFLTVHFGVNYSEDESAKGSYLGLLLGDVTTKDRPAPATLSGFELVVDGERVTATTAQVTARRTATQLDGTVEGTLDSGTPLTATFTCPIT